MKRILSTAAILLIGIAVGAAGTLGWSVFRPFAGPAPAAAPQLTETPDGKRLETFYFDGPADMVAVTHDGSKPVPPYPEGIATFDADVLGNGFVLVTTVRDADSNVVGFAVEQEEVTADSSILQGRMRMYTSWTVTLPGRGTIFLYQVEDGSEFARTAVIPALAGGQEFEAGDEPFYFVTTVGPNADGTGQITGGSGEFDGIWGTFRELSWLQRFSTDGEMAGRFALELVYDLPQT